MNQAILMLSLAFLLSCSTTGKSSWPVLKDREVNTEFTLKGEELAVIETVVSTLEQSYGKDEVDGQFIASNDSIITLNVYYTYEGNLVQKTEIIRGKKENISEELIANYYAVNELLNPIIGQRKSMILPTIQQMNSSQHTLHPRSKPEKTRKTKSVILSRVPIVVMP
jgi:hypothetical protein